MSEEVAEIKDFKLMAAQAARGQLPVWRWYGKFVHSEYPKNIYELATFDQLSKKHRLGWKTHKKDLKQLDFGVVRDGGVFLLFVAGEQARAWCHEQGWITRSSG